MRSLLGYMSTNKLAERRELAGRLLMSTRGRGVLSPAGDSIRSTGLTGCKVGEEGESVVGKKAATARYVSLDVLT